MMPDYFLRSNFPGDVNAFHVSISLNSKGLTLLEMKPLNRQYSLHLKWIPIYFHKRILSELFMNI